MTIKFTPEKFKRFKKAYKKAVEQNVSIFKFEGHELVVDYAKYLIEYLELQLKQTK